MIKLVLKCHGNLFHNFAVFIDFRAFWFSLSYIYAIFFTLWVGVEYAHRIPACRMRRLKGCPKGSASVSVGLRRHPVYPVTGCWPKTLPTFSNLSCQVPTHPFLHMVQHVADWVAPFSRSKHSPPPPHKLLHIPRSPPPFSSFPYMHES